MMRVCLFAMIAVGSVATASTAFAACGPHRDDIRPVGICAAPLSVGYGLGPTDSRRDLYIVNQGPVYEGPNVFTSAPPVYFESGFADEMPYPSVQFHTFSHGQHFYQAVSWRHRRHAQRSRSYPAYSTD
jgi:hypothetical protein